MRFIVRDDVSVTIVNPAKTAEPIEVRLGCGLNRLRWVQRSRY